MTITLNKFLAALVVATAVGFAGAAVVEEYEPAPVKQGTVFQPASEIAGDVVDHEEDVFSTDERS